MTTTLLLDPARVACRRCGAAIPLGAKAALHGSVNVLLDCACGSCGHRALYQAPWAATRELK